MHLSRLSSSQTIIMGFLILLGLGTLLLCLPFASQPEGGASFLDALFTATSSLCVTGLVVQDTATYWTTFGQLVILSLIQIGGTGVITMAILMSVISGRKIGLRQRSLMQYSISAPKVGGIIRFTNKIIVASLLLELGGALFLAWRFSRFYDLGKSLYFGIFHAISSFCNAGFDLMGEEGKFSSMSKFAAEPGINLCLMFLIIVGGIGFSVWDDVAENKFRFRRYSLHTKLVLLTSAFLIVLPALYFYLVEFKHADMPRRAWISIFQSVTCRTAGFSTTDLTDISHPGLGLMILLMLVGGSPGSTAGGIKTTTLAVLAATTVSVFRQRSDTQVMGRRIPADSTRKAVAILSLYLSLFIAAAMAICLIDKLPFYKCLFETASAMGTVGLSLGITTSLGTVSRLIIITLMFVGRVGGLTLIFATLKQSNIYAGRFPEEKVSIG